ncbi:hypothetical protein NC652_028821 [Populus alba x Populus x berolinensis]|nr:hypothetical protein NC652_028821 [Populus alba x Populus x berolinensis]
MKPCGLCMHFYLLSWQLRFCLACDSWRLKGQDSRDPFEVGFFGLKMMLRVLGNAAAITEAAEINGFMISSSHQKLLCFSECSLSRKKWSGTHRDENLRRKGDEGRRFTCCLCHE